MQILDADCKNAAATRCEILVDSASKKWLFQIWTRQCELWHGLPIQMNGTQILIQNLRQNSSCTHTPRLSSHFVVASQARCSCDVPRNVHICIFVQFLNERQLQAALGWSSFQNCADVSAILAVIGPLRGDHTWSTANCCAVIAVVSSTSAAQQLAVIHVWLTCNSPL